jgi:hypothetical protein
MSDEELKGIFTPDQERLLANAADEAIKAKGWLEIIDGYVARVAIAVVDNQLVDKLKAEIKVQFANVVTLVLNKEYEQAESALAVTLNGLIDIPGLDETSEGLLFEGAIKLLGGALLAWIEKRKAEQPVV